MVDEPARQRLNRAETKEQTHLLLLQAAERVFLKMGYIGATLDSIAADAGFTKGAVYWHFDSKEALFLELLATGMKRNAEDARRVLDLMAEHPHRIDEVMGEWFDRFDAMSSVPLLGLEMDMESRRNPALAAALVQVVREQRKGVCQFLDRYFDLVNRDPPMPVMELASTMIALSKAVALARLTWHSATLNTAQAVRLIMGMPLTR
ncbi:MAG TPA: helix-turn-helix domain-containing protein [Sphingomicrobium sp.]|nr:helix-turn-helix domain-containing protein [Sphingomicrobium sp.]